MTLREEAEKLAQAVDLGSYIHESSDPVNALREFIETALQKVRDEALEEAASMVFKGTAVQGYYGAGPQVLADAICSLKSEAKEKA